MNDIDMIETLSIHDSMNKPKIEFISKEFENKDVLQSLKIVFIFANSAYPDEISCSAAFHLGLHCLSKYRGVSGIQRGLRRFIDQFKIASVIPFKLI